MKRTHYQTAGRVALTRFLEMNPDRQFTADELYDALQGTHTDIGKSSVYRLLGELCYMETVRKFRSAERQCNVYQYIGASCDCRDHFHVKCTKCGQIRHLDCNATLDFARHLLSDHGFSVDCGRSMLYGVCAVCSAEV